MSIEILRELTEAMEIASNGGGVNFYEYAKDGRKALAELEKREPAAWGMENDDGQIYDCITPEEHAREEGAYTVALYREPQPNVTTSDTKQEHVDKTAKQRHEWVGLTDEEIEAKFKQCGGKWNGDQWVIEDADLHPFVRSIESPDIKTLKAISDEYNAWIRHHAVGHSYDDFLQAKLKELNT